MIISVGLPKIAGSSPAVVVAFVGVSQGTSTPQSNQLKSGTGICKEFTPSICRSLYPEDWFFIKGESICLAPRKSGGNTGLIHLGGPERTFLTRRIVSQYFMGTLILIIYQVFIYYHSNNIKFTITT